MVMKPISPFNHRMRCDKGEFSAKRRRSGSTRYFNASPFYTQAQWVLVFWYLRRYDLIRLVPAADPEFSGEKVLTGREKVSKRLFRNLFPMNCMVRYGLHPNIDIDYYSLPAGYRLPYQVTIFLVPRAFFCSFLS